MKTKLSAARSLDDLVHAGLMPAVTPELREVASRFAVGITPAMLELIDPDDANDPIAAQFMPKTDELAVRAEELADPISDHSFTPVKGVVHRYPDRVLLKLTLNCPVHCRYCFRREMLDDPEGTLAPDEMEQAMGYIAAHPEIWEVILTGGDPLMLTDAHLAGVVARLNAIPHVKIIRVHTRIPVTQPERITPDLIAALKGRAPAYVFLHCNHPRELTEAMRTAVARFVDAGIPLMSQSVLLRGVNDDAETLEALMRTFVENRIKPHYLHHADLARGTGHFRVTLERGRELMRRLRGNLSGLAQPTYVLDIPGGYGKVPIGPDYLTETENGWSIEDFRGDAHPYEE